MRAIINYYSLASTESRLLLIGECKANWRLYVVLPAQPVDATQALNLSAGVSNPKVLRGRSLS